MWHAEIWNLDGDTRIIADVPAIRADTAPALNMIGRGSITLPATYDRLNEIIDSSVDPPVVTQIRVYDDADLNYAFFAEDLKEVYSDEAGRIVTITGRGIESVMEWAVAYPRDWPANPTVAPDWSWGGSGSYIENGGAEDDPYALTNPKAELCDESGWQTDGSVTTFETVNNPTNAYEGNCYFRIVPAAVHAGIKQTFGVVPGGRYVITAYIKDPSATGRRFTISTNLAGTVYGTGNHRYTPMNDVTAELDGAAYNGGAPGGASDGTWQQLILDVAAGPSQESAYIIAKFDDHRGSATAPPTEFWFDGLDIEGPGIGISPWEDESSGGTGAVAIWASDDDPISGAFSFKVANADSNANAVMTQPITLAPGGTYTVGYKVQYPASPPYNLQGTWIYILDASDDSTIASQYLANPSDTAVHSEILTFTMPTDADEIIVKIVAVGPPGG